MNKPSISVSDERQFLSELITEDSEKDKEARRRRSPTISKSVPHSDVEAEVERGWEIQKENRRTTRLKRAKRHDQWLEDRIWSLLYRMKFAKIGGEHFQIDFNRDDGSRGRKQIDVFACDDETALVVECKSREVRGRRSLQKDIQETVSLQNYIRQSIYDLYADGPKPRVIWVYATSNIIWSENDVERALDGNIEILTDNEIQYFEAFIKHMGPAGKYQVLGEFLKGQKISGLGEIKLPAIRGKIGGETFYSFVATPRRLLKLAFINHQALNHPDGRPAYQRMISSSRIKEIEKFISSGGFFPTNLLVNFTTPPKFDLISNKENTDPNIKFGWITLPTTYRSAWVIDGQHRLYGYSNLDDKHLDDSLFVLAFVRMNTRKEADLFITINHKQKSVPKSLLVALLADIRMGDSDSSTALSALASAVIRAVNVDKTSPFTRRFSIPGIPPEPNQNLTISEGVNGLRRSGLIGRIVEKKIVDGPLSSSTDEKTVDRARKVLNFYFDRLRAANPVRWEGGKANYVSTNPGVRAHLTLIAEIVRYLEHKRGLDFMSISVDQFGEHVTEIAEPVFEFVRLASDDQIQDAFSRKFGEGGVREYLYFLLRLINDQRDDFGSEEFTRWVKQSESEKITETNVFIMNLGEKLTDFVIDTLKAVHGTRRLESGEQAFWEIGVQSKRVRDNAYNKQQSETDRRRPKEAYLDIVDLAEIVKQPNNWDHFEPDFNNPLPEEKGKKYYLQWLFDFNELRKIAAHKNQLKTYTDEDLEFIEWLRTEVAPKFDGIGTVG